MDASEESSHTPETDAPPGEPSAVETDLEIPNRLQIMKLALAVEGGLAGLALILAWLSARDLFEGVRFRPRSLVIGLAASLPMFAFLAFSVRSRAPLFLRIREILDEVLLPWLTPCHLIDIAVLASLAGFAEELLFRAYLQAMLGDWLGPVAGLVFASVVFGVVHWITPGYALLAGVAGLYLGAVWLVTDGDTLAVMIAHGFYDFVALLLLLKWHRERHAASPPAT